MTRGGAIAGAVFLAGALAAPAMAQITKEQQRMMEMSCVYNGVSKLDDDTFFAIGDMVIYDQSEGEEFEQLTKIVTDVADACATVHGWDETRIGYATEMGLQGVVSDTLATDLIDTGLTEEQLRKVDGLLDTMSDADFDRLYFGTWRDDPAERAELDKLWIANGIPQSDVIRELLPAYVETSIVTLSLAEQWTAEFPL